MNNDNMKSVQTVLYDVEKTDISKWILSNFSHDNLCEDSERRSIELRYSTITEVTDKFNRKSVSYQLSKTDDVQRWLKYKEGFSADLVNNLLEIMKISKGGHVLDPFLGSGTTALVCKLNGINSYGFDILPTSKLSIRAKDRIYEYDTHELKCILDDITNLKPPSDYKPHLNYLKITQGAYPTYNEIFISYATDWIESSHYAEISKALVKLCITNILERSSYTRKDGQYLSWDYRSEKTIKANERRIINGQEKKIRLDKGEIDNAQQALTQELINLNSRTLL